MGVNVGNLILNLFKYLFIYLVLNKLAVVFNLYSDLVICSSRLLGELALSRGNVGA